MESKIYSFLVGLAGAFAFSIFAGFWVVVGGFLYSPAEVAPFIIK